MSDDRIKAWLDERRKVHVAATPEMYFQHWGGQNQNGDYAESILLDERTGDSLAYGLPDADGEFIVDAHNHLPVALSAIEAVLELHGPEHEFGFLTVCKECVEFDEPDNLDSDAATRVVYPCPTRRALEAVIGGE